MNENIKTKIDCPSCGALSVGGLDGCLSLFVNLGLREFTNADYFKMHRLSVDAYCLQHPEQYMVSSKSAAAHLAAMCWTMEIEKSLHMPAQLKLWVDGPRRYVRILPPPLCNLGDLTIIDVFGTKNPEEYETKVWQWAKSAWDAWSDHWDQARVWVQEAISEYESNLLRR